MTYNHKASFFFGGGGGRGGVWNPALWLLGQGHFGFAPIQFHECENGYVEHNVLMWRLVTSASIPQRLAHLLFSP